MNKRIAELAKASGFVFWDNEAHGPGPGNIDWANDYTRELEVFARLIVEECCSVADDHSERKIMNQFEV